MVVIRGVQRAGLGGNLNGLRRVKARINPVLLDPFFKSSYNSFFVLLYGPLGQPTYAYNKS